MVLETVQEYPAMFRHDLDKAVPIGPEYRYGKIQIPFQGLNTRYALDARAGAENRYLGSYCPEKDGTARISAPVMGYFEYICLKHSI